jgi:hypothetical protein
MSDALLTEISGKLSDILAALKGGAAPAKTTASTGAATGGANKGATTAGATAGNKAGTATGGANKGATAAGGANKAAGAAAGTKAPGGKHTVEEVRDIIRKVATNEALGQQSAKDILDQDGGGAPNVKELKPQFYDAVFDACQVLIQTEGSKPAASAPEDDLM